MVPQRQPDVLHYDVQDETVIYRPLTAQAASLNPSASAVWALCDGRHSIADMCRQLAEETAISPPALEEDVRRAVEELAALGFVTMTEA